MFKEWITLSCGYVAIQRIKCAAMRCSLFRSHIRQSLNTARGGGGGGDSKKIG